MVALIISCHAASTFSRHASHALRRLAFCNRGPLPPWNPAATNKPLCRRLVATQAETMSTSASAADAKPIDAPLPPPSDSSAPHQDSRPHRRPRRRRVTTGGLKHLPIAMPANELYSRAYRIARAVKIDDTRVKNPRMKARKLGATQLDTLTKEITRPLKDIIRAYEEQLPILHPFEATLADLTVRARVKQGAKTLDEVLDSVNSLRKQVLEMGKLYAGAAKHALTKAEAEARLEEGKEAIEALMLQNTEVLLNLIEVQKSLRKLPIVRLDSPTVVLVGAPNVGKSSIVRAISSGTPEVNDYPFTTRGMTLGHIQYEDFEDKCQVMDTPGVLNRPDEERNEMESLTLASMQHLPTAVMFVLDLTGQSGVKSSIQNQVEIRNHLRERFPVRPWIDVISKADMGEDQGDPAIAMARITTLLSGCVVVMGDVMWQAPEGALRVSVVDGSGVEELKARVRAMLVDVREVLQQIKLAEEQSISRDSGRRGEPGS